MTADPSSPFPPDFHFRGTWRVYQKRILDELEWIGRDRHIHIVAAPGSGKTVLGLEILLRLGAPALVCAPSTTIRDQWRERLLELFLPPGTVPPGWCSTEPAPGTLITLATYQQIDSWCRSSGPGPFLEQLKNSGVRTLVLDEAHHLRKTWWEHLFAIKKQIESPVVVSLTATPPYDTPQIEWNRYIALAGPIGDEISIPELVSSGALCPHQDHLFLLHPTAEETARSRSFRSHAASFLADLALDPDFLHILHSHPWTTDPADSVVLRDILRNREAAIAMLLWMRHASGVAPPALAMALGLENHTLPAAGPTAAARLLAHILFRDPPFRSAHQKALDSLEKQLRGIGAVHGTRIDLRGSAPLNRRLRASSAKIRAVADILELESREMGGLLRAAVITDHIRPEALGAPRPVQRLGVVPIFEHIRRLQLPGVLPAVLCGPLTIIPATALPHLRQLVPTAFPATLLGHDSNYVQIDPGGDGARWVGPLTRLLADGMINAMISTGALLGQGWDALALNTIVLASSVGSSIATNQYRGRVLRIDPRHPEKAASIWHLVCHDWEAAAADHSALAPPTDEDQAGDWELLQRRFTHFPGLHVRQHLLTNALERLIDTPFQEPIERNGGVPPADVIAPLTAWFCARAANRFSMASDWRLALGDTPLAGTTAPQRLARELYYPVPRLAFTPVARLAAPLSGGWRDAWRRWRLHRLLSHIASALHASLNQCGRLEPGDGHHPRISLSGTHLRARLHGASTGDQSLFLDAFQEIFDPFCEPAFLIHSRGLHYCVPPTLSGRRRAPAEIFMHHLRGILPRDVALLHTARGEGAAHLRRAQTAALAQWLDSGDGGLRMVWNRALPQPPSPLSRFLPWR